MIANELSEKIRVKRCPIMFVSMETVCSGEYVVSSFFEAVHALASRAMPENRDLWEYIVITNLLGKLIGRLFKQLIDEGLFPLFVSTSIGLLVSQICNLEPGQAPISRAIIGFSLIGNKKKKKKSINNRKRNLPDLDSITSSNIELDWMPGNCAEAENFAHLESMKMRLLEQIRDANVTISGESPEILVTCLTMRLGEKENYSTPMKGKQFCGFCKQLAEMLSQRFSCQIVDISPL